MKRYTGQKALYEAIAKTQAKLQRRGILERLRPGDSKEKCAPLAAVEEPKPPVEPVSVPVEPLRPLAEKPVAEKPPVPVARPVRPVEHREPQPHPGQSWLRPKAVQLHDGRIEVSLPYTIGITVLLVAVLLILGAFRLGQMQHRYRLPPVNNSVSDKAKPPAPTVNPDSARQEAPAPVREAPAPDTGGATSVAPVEEGDHIIVLAQLAQSAPLEAAQAYFKEHGIETAVLDVAKLRDYLVGQGLSTSVLGNRGGYMLVSRKYYDNPESPGTKGYKAKQEIIGVGRGYKAKAGSESFPNHFSDAYGMKVR